VRGLRAQGLRLATREVLDVQLDMKAETGGAATLQQEIVPSGTAKPEDETLPLPLSDRAARKVKSRPAPAAKSSKPLKQPAETLKQEPAAAEKPHEQTEEKGKGLLAMLSRKKAQAGQGSASGATPELDFGDEKTEKER
ncbi:MAG: hypothetical protein LLF89_07025, partial [Spirochaetaceae bacterium]|nr:hypothetical protein [Spirochaetaceae bacterium]